MKYEYGDVVLYGGLTYVVVGTDDEYDTVDLLNQASCTTQVLTDEVKSIGHEDNFRDNVKSLLAKHKKQFTQTLLENQKAMVSLLAGKTFLFMTPLTTLQVKPKSMVTTYIAASMKTIYMTGFYCQHCWINFFVNKYLTHYFDMLQCNCR